MSILLTGGAGYIGSITNQYLKSKGVHTVIFDNLHTGHQQNVADSAFFQGDLRSKHDLQAVFSQYFIEGVIHFGALALSGESMEKPADYYQTNVLGTVNLLDVMSEFGCKKIVFSSSCSVFGNPETLPVNENFAFNPQSVYAQTKLMGEQILDRYDQLFDIKHVKLRYFNAAGAMLDGSLGENHNPETHIIPNLISAARNNQPFTLFGNDYQTPDGSCIRDYIHVLDLAQAHHLALEYLGQNQLSNHFNLGSENGFSNLELIRQVESIASKKINVVVAPRRPGDPKAIYADSTKAKQTLMWQPQFSDIKTIISSSWNWHKSQ